ncbi:hypothetical protein SADO_12778 [Salinisphaera dokdonensis CL-ES53]|uniref:Uncharacterized protein n=1 Tax=Salinisphaera dokdonensis CL-ES53 TaxID=1304272 RepID=A0ABV2B3X8_9GAMM
MNVNDQPSIPASHLDIGGVALPREELSQVLPDMARFEQHLPDALAIDTQMREGDGSIPAYVQDWPQERVAAVVATLKELGSLREQASEQIKSHRANSQGKS